MGQIITLPHRFNPRPYQSDIFDAYFAGGYKRIIQVLHRRAGKDKDALNLMIAASQQRVGTYLYLLPTQKQARTVIWENIDRDGMRYLDHFPPELLSQPPKSTTMTIYLKNGSIFQFGGADYFDSYMGSNPVFIGFSEFSLQHPRAWPHFDPILTENGGSAIFNFTPRGRNHAYTLYKANINNPDWYVKCMTVDDTVDNDGKRIIEASDIDKRRAEGMDEALIQQEYYCDFEATLPGAYYSDQVKKAYDENRIRNFPIDEGVPVYTFWDLGVNDSTAIWFMQPVDGELRIIHTFQDCNKGLDHYAAYLDEFAAKYHIKYSRHFAPFDVNVKELGTGLTRKQVARQFGIGFSDVPMLRIIEGIQAVRALFPRFVFNENMCDDGIEALKGYHREYDDKYDTYKNKAVHDWTSHYADAFRYMCVAWRASFMKEERISTYKMPSFSV